MVAPPSYPYDLAGAGARASVRLFRARSSGEGDPSTATIEALRGALRSCLRSGQLTGVALLSSITAVGMPRWHPLNALLDLDGARRGSSVNDRALNYCGRSFVGNRPAPLCSWWSPSSLSIERPIAIQTRTGLPVRSCVMPGSRHPRIRSASGRPLAATVSDSGPHRRCGAGL